MEPTTGPGLTDYLNWTKRFFIIDLNRLVLIRCPVPIDEGYEIVGGVVPARTRQSKLSQLKPSADGPCRPQCDDALCTVLVAQSLLSSSRASNVVTAAHQLVRLRKLQLLRLCVHTTTRTHVVLIVTCVRHFVLTA